MVVGTRGEERARGVPLNGVDLVAVALEAAQVVRRVEFADVDHAVSRARGERVVVAPIHVQRRLFVEGELLLDGARGGVPYHRRLVHRARQEVPPALVPLEREDGPLVPREGLHQRAVGAPDARLPVVRARRERRAVVVPVERRHVLGLLLVPRHVVQHHRRRVLAPLPARPLWHGPDARCGVARAARQLKPLRTPRADEHLGAVADERRHVLLWRLQLLAAAGPAVAVNRHRLRRLGAADPPLLHRRLARAACPTLLLLYLLLLSMLLLFPLLFALSAAGRQVEGRRLAVRAVLCHRPLELGVHDAALDQVDKLPGRDFRAVDVALCHHRLATKRKGRVAEACVQRRRVVGGAYSARFAATAAQKQSQIRRAAPRDAATHLTRASTGR